jgi:hypothetical protein
MHVYKLLLSTKRCQSYLVSKYCRLTEGKLSYVDQEAVFIVYPVTNLDITFAWDMQTPSSEYRWEAGNHLPDYNVL